MSGARAWLARRAFPLAATAALVAIGLASTTWWGPGLVGKTAWSLPDDLWGTMTAAQRLLHMDWSGLYTRPTALISFPGAAVILVPLVAVLDASGLSLRVQSAHNPHPGAWLLAGPYEIVMSSVALLAADAIAGHLGVSRPKRALLAGAGAVALWSVSVRWGHPEDAVAVGLFLFALLALARSRPGRSAWLAGSAVAVQPLVLLALPAVLVMLPPRRIAGFLTRAAVPGAALLGAAAWANWNATVRAVASQPNWPATDHPTPWASLAPHLGHGAVAAGPARFLAVVVACACALAAGRRLRPVAGTAGWNPVVLREMVWWAAVALALRSVFEPVMVAYYLWPVLAVALVAAAGTWPRLAAASAAATVLTFASQVSWGAPWAWWAAMVVGLGVTLWISWRPLALRPAAALPEAWGRSVAGGLPARPGPDPDADLPAGPDAAASHDLSRSLDPRA